MKNLLWLLIPLVALIVGIVWAYLISRPPRPAAMQDSMETFSRFRHALATKPGAKPGAKSTTTPATTPGTTPTGTSAGSTTRPE